MSDITIFTGVVARGLVSAGGSTPHEFGRRTWHRAGHARYRTRSGEACGRRLEPRTVQSRSYWRCRQGSGGGRLREVVYVPEQTLFEPLFQIPGGNFQIAESTLMRLQASVRQYLFMDVLQGLGDRATSVEVQVRREEYFDNLGSVALRLEEEFLRPVIMSTCSILSDNRKLDLKEIDGQQIIVETNSIEKRVQKERDATRTAQALGVLAQSMEMIQKMGPEAGQTIDAAKTARHLLTNLGFPAECMRTEEEVAAQTKAEQAATVLAGKQQLEMGQASAETAPQVGRAVAGLLPDLLKATQ